MSYRKYAARTDSVGQTFQSNPIPSMTADLRRINKLVIQNRNGEVMTREKLDALLERMNQGKDIEQGIDLLAQLFRYL